jgi:hypothetical protein
MTPSLHIHIYYIQSQLRDKYYSKLEKSRSEYNNQETEGFFNKNIIGNTVLSDVLFPLRFLISVKSDYLKEIFTVFGYYLYYVLLIWV